MAHEVKMATQGDFSSGRGVTPPRKVKMSMQGDNVHAR